jgi:hypothetical protein
MAAELTSEVIFQAIRDIAAPGSVGLLGWWLSGRFRKTEEIARVAADKVEAKTEAMIEKHEIVDQGRHEENLKNFYDIKVRLARAGINGDHKG